VLEKLKGETNSMKKHIIHLTPAERTDLEAIARQQRVAAAKKLRAQVLLLSDQGERGPARTDTAIADQLPISVSTLEQLRLYACEVGPLEALTRRPTTRTYERKLDGRGEAELIRLACSPAPDGAAHWTMQLLADELVVLNIAETISDETVRRTLKKTNFVHT
jgi:hypothetical protein